ncbi:MAG: hypothetical protein RL685_423 [Pseudomonadota bacterium]|jgi:hypothetical protein
MSSERVHGTWSIVSRSVAAVLGGYAFSAACVALFAVGLPLSGMARSEAVLLASMLGFLLYLGAILWAFSERRLDRVWLVLAGGAVVAYGLMRLLRISTLNA